MPSHTARKVTTLSASGTRLIVRRNRLTMTPSNERLRRPSYPSEYVVP